MKWRYVKAEAHEMRRLYFELEDQNIMAQYCVTLRRCFWKFHVKYRSK